MWAGYCCYSYIYCQLIKYGQITKECAAPLNKDIEDLASLPKVRYSMSDDTGTCMTESTVRGMARSRSE